MGTRVEASEALGLSTQVSRKRRRDSCAHCTPGGVRGLPGCWTCELEHRQQSPSHRDEMLSGGQKGLECECE